MILKKPAVAGTLESSDAQIMIEPGGDSIVIDLTSTVMNQYGRQIRELILAELTLMEVGPCKVTINDHGALDCTLKARIEAAVFRSAEQTDNIPWGGMIR